MLASRTALLLVVAPAILAAQTSAEKAGPSLRSGRQASGWKSPVFLVHGDDDRNVDFSRTIGLVSLLRAKGVYYDLTVIPDDVHESLIHSRWIDIFARSSDFLHRFVWEKQVTANTNDVL